MCYGENGTVKFLEMYLGITIPWCKLKKINRCENFGVTQAYTLKFRVLTMYAFLAHTQFIWWRTDFHALIDWLVIDVNFSNISAISWCEQYFQTGQFNFIDNSADSNFIFINLLIEVYNIKCTTSDIVLC